MFGSRETARQRFNLRSEGGTSRVVTSLRGSTAHGCRSPLPIGNVSWRDSGEVRKDWAPTDHHRSQQQLRRHPAGQRQRSRRGSGRCSPGKVREGARLASMADDVAQDATRWAPRVPTPFRVSFCERDRTRSGGARRDRGNGSTFSLVSAPPAARADEDRRPAHCWGSRGRRFKSSQPDHSDQGVYGSKVRPVSPVVTDWSQVTRRFAPRPSGSGRP